MTPWHPPREWEEEESIHPPSVSWRCTVSWIANVPSEDVVIVISTKFQLVWMDIFMCGLLVLHGNKKNRNQNWESRIFLLQFRKGLKYFILIDADNFIKKHFITKEKTDSAHPPPHPAPHCLKSSQDVPRLGWGGRWVQQTRYFETRADVWAAHSLKCGSSH